MMGGAEGRKVPPLFLFVKALEKVIRLCNVLNFCLSGSFEDRAVFHVIELSYDWGALCAHYRSIDKFVKNAQLVLSNRI